MTDPLYCFVRYRKVAWLVFLLAVLAAKLTDSGLPNF